MFYHGTTDLFPINKVLLPPTDAYNQREEWRKKDIDKVFFTNSVVSAEKYADKAARKFGGNPIIYKIKPIGNFYKTINTEYIADRAIVIGVL